MTSAGTRPLDPPDLDGLGINVANSPILGADFGMHDVSLEEVYEAMLLTRGERFAAVIAGLADPATGPALLFCSAGKDR